MICSVRNRVRIVGMAFDAFRVDHLVVSDVSVFLKYGKYACFHQSVFLCLFDDFDVLRYFLAPILKIFQGLEATF